MKQNRREDIDLGFNTEYSSWVCNYKANENISLYHRFHPDSFLVEGTRAFEKKIEELSRLYDLDEALWKSYEGVENKL